MTGAARTGPLVTLPVESANVSSLRRANRALVLTQIVLEGQTTRAEIARATGLSLASATNFSAELIAEGLVMEAGSLSSRGGRPITLLKPRAQGAYFVGADVGERGVAVEMFDLTMTRVDREFRGGREHEDPNTIADDLNAALEALRGRHPQEWAHLAGVGLGLPGIVETDADGEQTLYAQSNGWPPVAIRDLVAVVDVPVYAKNGAETQAKAEQWFGAARGVEDAAVVLLGRGVGLGLVSAGQLLTGAFGGATEWGHTKIERGGRSCRCGGRGCLEAYVGADAILQAWSDQGGRFEGSGWQALGALLDSAAQGERAAQGVVDEVVECLGAALGSLVNMTNPRLIVMGGWVGIRLMQSLAERIDVAIRLNALDRPGGQYELLASTFAGDTVAVGAAVMPLETLISGPGSSMGDRGR